MKHEVFVRQGTKIFPEGGSADSPRYDYKSVGEAKHRSRALRRAGHVVRDMTPVLVDDAAVVVREGHMLYHPDGNPENCGSINAAKRKSTALQKSGTKVRVKHYHQPAPKQAEPEIKVKPKKKYTARPNWKTRRDDTDAVNV